VIPGCHAFGLLLTGMYENLSFFLNNIANCSRINWLHFDATVQIRNEQLVILKLRVRSCLREGGDFEQVL
jgi:Tfp pilus assembly protein PilO